MAAGIAAGAAVGSGSEAGMAAAGRSEAARCRSLDRGLEACGRESRLCRGRVGSRAFCGGGL